MSFATYHQHRSPAISIIGISALGLFIELMLIRWIGSEIRIFAYLQNTVLVVCFLGLSLGCLSCRREVELGGVLAGLCSLSTLLALPQTQHTLFQISNLLGSLSDLVIWNQRFAASPTLTILNVVVGLLLTLVLMVIILYTFVPLGRILGRLMDDAPHTIYAYSLNVLGSLGGILLFVGVSALGFGPAVWMAIAVSGTLAFVDLRSGNRSVVLLLVIGAIASAPFAGYQPKAGQLYWSPYQKLSVHPAPPPPFLPDGTLVINVNNTGYQALQDLREQHTKTHPEIFPPDLRGYSQYDIPLKLHPRPKKVLIVGAGSGNDVAAAIRNGAEEIVAVDIDPVIVELGRRLHPEQPYTDSRVRVVIDDARSFFASTPERFDVISFGILDSHTTTSMTNARLDHYVYTQESIERAKTLLEPGGIIALNFVIRRDFIARRFAETLRQVFHAEPFVFPIPESSYNWGGVMFVAGALDSVQSQLLADARLGELIERWKKTQSVDVSPGIEPATDDWPYLYLEQRSIPTLYFLLAGLLGLLVLYARWATLLPRTTVLCSRQHAHFFFLGAGFLLLEVQNISKAAVVLGNTWLVNAVIIAGILLMILLANIFAACFKHVPNWIIYSLLIGSCVLLYLVDLDTFAALPYVHKAVLVGAFCTLPLFFSGIIFIRSFASTREKDAALGANLLGALCGGLLQSLTFVVGIKALLIIVAALYALASATERQSASPACFSGHT